MGRYTAASKGRVPALASMRIIMMLLCAMLFTVSAGRPPKTTDACLFHVDIELLSASGSVLYSTAAASTPRRLCRSYPLADEQLSKKFMAAWRGFDALSTLQFVVPATVEVASATSSIRLVASTTQSFSALHGAAVSTTANGSLLLPYPPPDAVAGDPLHASLLKGEVPSSGQARALMAVFVSFEQPPPTTGHVLHVHTDEDLPGGSPTGGVWRCATTNKQPWLTTSSPVEYIHFLAPLASNTTFADGHPLTLLLSDTADIGVPISNTYAAHAVVDSPGCRALCAALVTNPALDLFGNADAATCALRSPPAFKAASGYGAITVRGYGRVNGQTMMRRFLFKGVPVWNPKGGAGGAGGAALNSYGSVVSGFKTIADAEPHSRWRVMSGLLELSSAAAVPSAAHPFAIDIHGISVAWGAKRGDGSLRLQFPRVPLDGASDTVASSNQPARLYDVKTPGTWVGASDGPRVTADGSTFAFVYLQHADDNLKIDSSRGDYHHLTLIQGNIGSAIELGTYGIGLRNNAVVDTRVDGVAIHRITQDPGGQDDQLGSVLGSRTCPWGITFKNISVSNVHVHKLGDNRFSSLWAVGALGAPFGPHYQHLKNLSTLDRWFFCSNEWWRGCTHGGAVPDCNTVRQSGVAATFESLDFANWTGLGAVDGTSPSVLYNFAENASTMFTNVAFNAIRVSSLDDLLGEKVLLAQGSNPRSLKDHRGDDMMKGGKICAITDHGATPASNNNTAAIAAAIAACSGGGIVVVPSGGAFKTGPLHVTGSNITIQFQTGASLEAAFGPDDWPVTSSASLAGSLDSLEEHNTGIHVSSGHFQDFLVFEKCAGCGLVGKGTLFGKGGRPPAGNDWYYLFDQHKLKHSRPKMLVVSSCTDFTMKDIKILDAPEFNVALNGVTRAEISGVNITSTWYIDPKTKKLMEPHNTDGIDPGGGSSDIHIHDIWIHNGDDSVAVKPSALGDCTRNILVENSHFEHGHGCSIGSVGGGCVENVMFRNITMSNQECGCRVKTYSESEGHVHNITWQNIVIKDTSACVTVNANYKPLPKDPKHFIDVRGLVFKDIVGTGCSDGPEFTCPSQAPCENITLDNVKLSGKAGSKDLKMKCLNAHGTAVGAVPESCLNV